MAMKKPENHDGGGNHRPASDIGPDRNRGEPGVDAASNRWSASGVLPNRRNSLPLQTCSVASVASCGEKAAARKEPCRERQKRLKSVNCTLTAKGAREWARTTRYPGLQHDFGV